VGALFVVIINGVVAASPVAVGGGGRRPAVRRVGELAPAETGPDRTRATGRPGDRTGRPDRTADPSGPGDRRTRADRPADRTGPGDRIGPRTADRAVVMRARWILSRKRARMPGHRGGYP